MKKTTSLFLLICLLFTLISCGTTYEPVPSTEEEERVVMTLTVDGEVYEIKYELYRALFLTHKSSVDGGDESVWSGASAEEYVNEINGIIVSRASQIFATLHEAEKIGFDPYGIEVESKIQDYVRVSVEGGSFGDSFVEGEGSYEKYLAALKALYLNYSVQSLLIRYSLASAALEEYYLGNEEDPFDEGEKFEFLESDVREYYFGEECASFMQIFLYSHAYDLTRVNEIRASIADKSSKTAVAQYMINFSTAGYEEIFDGSVTGRYELDRAYFADLTDSIFALAAGETSEPIKIGSGSDEGYYITYRFAPSEDYFENHYGLVKKSFILNALGKKLSECENTLSGSSAKAPAYSEIIHSEIGMD